MSEAEIKAAIAEISEHMKGPLPYIERLLLHEERRELRATLAALTASTGTGLKRGTNPK